MAKIGYMKRGVRMLSRSVMIIALLSLVLSVPYNVAAQSQEIQDSDLEGLVITMRQENRCGCEGCCSIYSVSISGDGVVTYEGIEAVKMTGKQVYSIQIEQVKELVKEFYKVDFFSLKDKYTYSEDSNGTRSFISHAAPITTSITINGKTKSVYNFFEAPEKLKGLEKKIYDASQIDIYVRRT